MAGAGEQESLAYWLELKNDEVFPGLRFGSIAGGSAFKFGVYRRDADGAWVTGTGINPRVIETPEAAEIVRRQRARSAPSRCGDPRHAVSRSS